MISRLVHLSHLKKFHIYRLKWPGGKTGEIGKVFSFFAIKLHFIVSKTPIVDFYFRQDASMTKIIIFNNGLIDGLNAKSS